MLNHSKVYFINSPHETIRITVSFNYLRQAIWFFMADHWNYRNDLQKYASRSMINNWFLNQHIQFSGARFHLKDSYQTRYSTQCIFKLHIKWKLIKIWDAFSIDRKFNPLVYLIPLKRHFNQMNPWKLIISIYLNA